MNRPRVKKKKPEKAWSGRIVPLPSSERMYDGEKSDWICRDELGMMSDKEVKETLKWWNDDTIRAEQKAARDVIRGQQNDL